MSNAAPASNAPTENAPPSPADAGSPVDLQRQSLELVARLSVECAAEERRADDERATAAARAEGALRAATRAAEERRQRREEELTADVTQRREAIQAEYEAKRQAVEAEGQAAQQRALRDRRDAESRIKKEFEEASWRAESELVTVRMAADTEEQKAKQEVEASEKELASLAELEAAVTAAIAGYGVEAPAVDVSADKELEKRLAKDRGAVLAESRQQAAGLLKEIQTLTEPRPLAWVVPTLLTVVLAAGAVAAGWFLAADEQSRLLYAAVAGAGAVAVGVIGAAVQRFRRRARIEAAIDAVYEPFIRSVSVAKRAARVDQAAAIARRERMVRDAKRKRELEVNAARQDAGDRLARAEERFRAALADEAARRKESLAAADQAKDQGLAALEQHQATVSREIEQEDATARQEAQAAFDRATQANEASYASQSAALTERWDEGLRAVERLTATGAGIEPALIDWESPAWDRWSPPKAFSGRVRFGELRVDPEKLAAEPPKRLRLPETFSVPATLALPAYASLFVETDHAGRAAAVDLAQTVMARLLTQIPPGRVKFTLFDPVGLGQSFAGFMHLADHDESLVGSRVWTEREHLEQRLADLTEHMETVIQKYLRNEYATIDEYNAQAGELAEPLRFLVVADFPTGFEAESLRRLASIATTGPRCGVYTIILRDTRQQLPPGARMEELVSRGVRLKQAGAGGFVWDDPVFRQFPLRVDPPPAEKTLTRLMDVVGKAAKEAKRVEVPFESIAPRDGQFWSLTSQADLRVPIGKSGAARLQALRLGVGVAQHALVAGKTGSGKSNLMHTIVTNLAMWYGPDEVEFYLVDFKKGVEFKAYAAAGLPHARAIAVESDREFGLSVLQRVDAELTRRGAMFRDVGAQEIGAYREKTGKPLPRTVLLIDEFQEFFSEDDKLAQEASGLLDRLVRQGRAFGVHVVLGSQTIGGNSGLARSTLGQIAVRVALQCTEADSQVILGDNNSAARLLTRPGEAVYNDAGGLVEANSPFQIAYLPDDRREAYLRRIQTVANAKPVATPAPIVFEGNVPADVRANAPLAALLARPDYPAAAPAVHAYLGEPVAIKAPTAVPFRRQVGANVLMVGQQEEAAAAMFAAVAASVAAQQKPGAATFYLLDGTPADARHAGLLERVLATLSHEKKVVPWRQTPDAINELAAVLAARREDEGQARASVYLLVFGLQRYRLLRQEEEDFSFSRKEEDEKPQPGKQFKDLLTEGPAVGMHTVIWADTPITVERTLERGLMRQFDYRVLFQMSASDSSNLIDSPLANRLGPNRALLYSEEQGTMEKFRPYGLPDEAWLEYLARHLAGRS